MPQGDPLRKFNVAFALVAVIPMLGFTWIVTEALSLSGLEGGRGGIFLLLIVISLLGYAVGYRIIRHLFEELVGYNRLLSRVNDLKSVFVSEVSHEVKNPLVTLRLSLSFLQENLVPSLAEDQREVLAGCQRSIERLIRLTNDLLDLAKIESGKMSMKKETVNLKALVEEALAFMKPRFGEKGLKLKSEFAGADFSLLGDQDHLTRIVINLLDNAIKYTPKGNAVGVGLTDEKKNLKLDIWNEGEAIPPEKRERIFEPYERISFNKETGTGLGLPIVKEILKLHQGTIQVERMDSANHFIATLPKDFRSHG